MAQTLWLNDRCNELIDELMEWTDASSKTGVVLRALECLSEELESESE